MPRETSVYKVPWVLWLVVIGLLVAATARLPLGFYTFLRLAVCAFGILIVVVEIQREGSGTVWAGAFGLLALLFNPVIPVYFNKATWVWIDFAAATFIAAHLLGVRIWRRL